MAWQEYVTALSYRLLHAPKWSFQVGEDPLFDTDEHVDTPIEKRRLGFVLLVFALFPAAHSIMSPLGALS